LILNRCRHPNRENRNAERDEAGDYLERKSSTSSHPKVQLWRRQREMLQLYIFHNSVFSRDTFHDVGDEQRVWLAFFPPSSPRKRSLPELFGSEKDVYMAQSLYRIH
jgi:hypothetical protein